MHDYDSFQTCTPSHHSQLLDTHNAVVVAGLDLDLPVAKVRQLALKSQNDIHESAESKHFT